MEFTLRKSTIVINLLLIVIAINDTSARSSSFYRTSGDTEERIIEFDPSSVTVRPRPRQRISSEFAKKYWISGNFFNRDNFKAIPTLGEARNDGPFVAEASFPRPVIIRAVPILLAGDENAESIQEL